MLKYYRHFVPDERDLTFYLCTHYDLELLEVCLGDLRRVYHESRVIVVSDGDPNPKIATICDQYQCEFHRRKWLYGLSHGGRRIHRMLELFFKNPSRFLLKIDTDTKICRPFSKPFPDKQCVFGKLHQDQDYSYIQGGCIVYHIKAAQALYENETFLDQSLVDDPYQWAHYEAAVWKIENGYISEDQINACCVQKSGIPMVDHPEIKSFSPDWDGVVAARELLELNPRNIAVIHPIKAKMSVW